MPEEEALPEDLQPLVYRNAWDVSDRRFHHDVQLLVDALKKRSSRVPAKLVVPKPKNVAASKSKSLVVRNGNIVIAKPLRGRESLFPVYGITLGETTVRELAKIGRRTSIVNDDTGKPDLYYTVKGIDFWYGESSSIVESILLFDGIQFPESWQALGFDWEISYDEWLSRLSKLGYMFEIEIPPRIEQRDGRDSFFAMVIGRMSEPCPHGIRLMFSYRGGTTIRSPGTLYKIHINVDDDDF